MQVVKDETMPDGRWQFDDDVTAVFDDMLTRSIPQYEVMRRACYDVGAPFVTPNTDIVDLGCSRGEAIAPFIDRFGALNRFVLVEVSDPMRTAVCERFKGLINTGIVFVKPYDLRHEYPSCLASLTLCVLTLQFVPIEYRQALVRQMYERTISGGAVILVEKVLGNTADLNQIMVSNYYALKAKNGYSQEQIERKRLSLEGVLVPVTAKWNEELLSMAGFRQVDCFWRWMNFAAWVAIK